MQRLLFAAEHVFAAYAALCVLTFLTHNEANRNKKFYQILFIPIRLLY